MEKDKLEQFVVNNKKEFGAPAPDIWSKIQKRKPKKDPVVITLKFVLTRVAAVVLIFFSSYYVHDFRAKNKVTSGKETATETATETNGTYSQMKEAEFYYLTEIKDKSEQFFSLTKNSPDMQADVRKDLAELDAIFLELKKDLMDNANNQEVLESMMQNYRLKLEILQDMLDQIKPEKQKNSEYEKVYSI